MCAHSVSGRVPEYDAGFSSRVFVVGVDKSVHEIAPLHRTQRDSSTSTTQLHTVD